MLRFHTLIPTLLLLAVPILSFAGEETLIATSTDGTLFVEVVAEPGPRERAGAMNVRGSERGERQLLG